MNVLIFSLNKYLPFSIAPLNWHGCKHLIVANRVVALVTIVQTVDCLDLWRKRCVTLYIIDIFQFHCNVSCSNCLCRVDWNKLVKLSDVIYDYCACWNQVKFTDEDWGVLEIFYWMILKKLHAMHLNSGVVVVWFCRIFCCIFVWNLWMAWHTLFISCMNIYKLLYCHDQVCFLTRTVSSEWKI